MMQVFAFKTIINHFLGRLVLAKSSPAKFSFYYHLNEKCIIAGLPSQQVSMSRFRGY